MENNNCNINLNQFEEQEIVPILTEAVNVANRKIASLKEELKTKVDSYEKERKESTLLSSAALDAAKKAAEKEKSDALDAARKAAEKEKSDALDAAKKAAEKEKSDALDAARKAAEKEKSDALDAAKKAAERERSDALDAAKKAAEREKSDALDTVQKEADVFRNNLKKNSISLFLGEISRLISEINPENEIWGKYILEIKKDFDELISSEKETDDVITELFKPNSGLTRLASIVWWHNQTELCDSILNIGRKVGELIVVANIFFKQLDLYNECIVLPPNGFNHTAEFYDSFSYKTSNIRELFPTIIIEKQVLCEIYQLARNNAKGKCYLS